MSTRRVRLIWSHLARLLVFALAALAFSSTPAQPLDASPLPPLAGRAHDATRPLSSGQALIWNTFLGASESDYANGLAFDANGNIYVVGDSYAAWQGSSLPVHAYAGGGDAFAAKLDPSGALIWTTFLGQSGYDSGSAIALDASGNIFIVGMSEDTWEGTSPPLRDYTAGRDVFVAKLSPNGELIWNTFLGGNGTDQGFGIAVAGDGNIYVSGNGTSAWQGTTTPRRGYGSGWDAFAAKLDPSGVLLWNTFLGGDGHDEGNALTLYGNDSIYVAGDSDVTWQGSSSPLRAYTAGYDSFVAKLNANGDLTWNAFLGGGGDDYGNSITVDGEGNVYMVGLSTDAWQGTSQPIRGYSAVGDGFVAKLSPAGALTWNTFLGGSGYDAGTAIAVDASSIYVAGRSSATWGSPARPYNSGADAFAAELSPSGSLTWNTFLGGSGTDQAFAVAPDGNGNLYVAGVSGATWGSPLRPFTSTEDAFIARIGAAYLNLPLIRR
jgi:hypothetical protein